VLEPLSSTVKTPAALGIRFTAGALDKFFSTFLLVTPIAPLLARPLSPFAAMYAVEHLVQVAYFAITESVWGASLGKAVCGLRVVTEDGTRPRFGPALARAVVFVLPGWLASGLILSITRLVFTWWPAGPIAVAASVNIVESLAVALLFVAARRANGLAAIHERASRTRTVLKAPVEARRIVRSVPNSTTILPSYQWIGPYRLVDPSNPQPGCGSALGYDERLRRAVWLRFPSVESDPVPLVRRLVHRPARPRWLAGQRTPALAWDAYEQVPGQPLETLVTQAQTWGVVREWIRDLAGELDEGLRDGSLPALELDRVWIGDDGRARLLDWPSSNDRRDSVATTPGRTTDLRQAQRFLHRVAVSALEGNGLADNPSHGRTTRVPLPLPAGDYLTKLGDQGFTTSQEMLTALRRAADGPAALSRTKRAVHLSLCAVPTILTLVLWFGGEVYAPWFTVPREGARPDIAELTACLGRLAALERAGVPATNIQHRALEVYVAGQHGALISDASTWSAPALARLEFSGEQRALAERVVTTWPNPQEADVADAARILSPFLDNVRRLGIGGPSIGRLLWVYAIAGLIIAATVGLVSAVAGRGGIALRLMKIAVVTKNGTLASGSRARLRSALSWFPVLGATVAIFAGQSGLLTLTPPLTMIPTPPPFYPIRVMILPPVFFLPDPSILVVRVTVITVALVTFGVGVLAAVMWPERGLQDRLAGTWLVPR
jgi:uncharacterized RDD family membrane protein YckC